MEKSVFKVWKKGFKGYFLIGGFYISISCVILSLIIFIFPYIDGRFQTAFYFMIAAGIFGLLAILLLIVTKEQISIEYDRKSDQLFIKRAGYKCITDNFRKIKNAEYQNVSVSVQSSASKGGLSKPFSSHFRIVFINVPFNNLLHFQTKGEMLKAGRTLQYLNSNLSIDAKIKKLFLSTNLVSDYL